MKYKNIIKTIFVDEQKNEFISFVALEQKLLNQYTMKYNRKSSQKIWKIPYAFLVGVVCLFIVTATVVATENPIKETAQKLTRQLQQAVENALKYGETKVDQHGQLVFTGQTAEEVERLHNETRDKITELEARPKEERQETIEFLTTWIDSNLYTAPNMPKQTEITYSGIHSLEYDLEHKVESYVTQDYNFYIDPYTNTVYKAEIIGSRSVHDPKETYIDNTARYDQKQIEDIAVAFIKKQLPEVELEDLNLEKGKKTTNYFFVWKGSMEMRKHMSDESGTTVCGDVEEPEFYDEEGTPCMKVSQSTIAPTIRVSFTQGGQLLQYSNDGF